MTDHVVIDSPFGPLAFSPEEINRASAVANELSLALVSPVEPTSTPTEPERWYTIDEVVALTGLKKSWLYQEVRADNIPHRRFGRQVRIPASYIAEPVPKSGAQRSGGQ